MCCAPSIICGPVIGRPFALIEVGNVTARRGNRRVPAPSSVNGVSIAPASSKQDRCSTVIMAQIPDLSEVVVPQRRVEVVVLLATNLEVATQNHRPLPVVV